MYSSMPNTSGQARIASLVAGFAGLIALVCLLSGGNFALAQSKEETPQGSANSCGFSWSNMDLPDISGSSSSITSIDALSPSDVWVAGDNTQAAPTPIDFLLEHYDGTSWTRISQDAIDVHLNYIPVVSAIAHDNVWAFGYSDASAIVPVHWDGSSWTTFPSPSTSITILDGKAISSSDIWLVGRLTVSGHDQSYATHWDGSSWTTMTVPGGIYTTSSLEAISVAAPDDIWVVGHTSEDSTGIAFTSHWDGTTWTPVPLPAALGTRSILYDVVAIAPDEAWAVGEYNDGDQLSVVLHWDGTAWGIEDALGNLPRTVMAFAPGDIWAMGLGQYLQVQHLDPYFGWSAVGGTDIFPSSTYVMNSVGVGNEIWVAGTTLLGHNPISWIRRYSEKLVSYADVAEDSSFFPYIKCLSCAGVISGYACGGAGEPCNATTDPYFRPSVSVTRGQLAKIVVGATGESLSNPVEASFQDVPSGSTFYMYIETLVGDQVISGYPCGGAGEPCVLPGNKPYFRPNATASRAQVAKITSETAGFDDTIAPGTKTFADVTEGSTFHVYVERLAERSIVSGYACGGVSEPCDSENRPYFRPVSLVTRGQAAKIVSSALMPSCQVGARK